MGKILKCDVLIIGAGPAGASLAYFLAGKGIETILIDKKAGIDTPVRCAEYVPAAAARLFDGPVSGIDRATSAMTTYIGYKEANTIRAPGLMLNRKNFLASITGGYLDKGGRFFNRTRAVSFNKNGRHIETSAIKEKDKEAVILSKIVAGADGPRSIAGQHMGTAGKGYVLGLNENIRAEAKDKNRTLVFFSPGIPGGYGWLFPKDKSINLGIGCQSPYGRAPASLDLKGIYEDFKKKIFSMKLIGPGHDQGRINGGKITAGLIPSSGMLKKTVKNGFVLAGDAAGLSNPITGAGIYNAIYSAKIISGIIQESIIKDDPHVLKRIEKEYREIFGTSLKRAAEKRKRLLNGWDDAGQDEESFNGLIRECWVAFKTYWNK